MKRKIMGLLVMLVFVGIMGAMPVMAWEITTSDGYVFTTDAKGYIKIGNAETLSKFAKFINDNEMPGDHNAKAVLTADIALRDTSNWTAWSATTPPTDIDTIPAWTPIGNTSSTYNGTFDGAGHTISGIYIKNDMYAQGLFGFCGDSANIKNLKITASYLKGATYTGGIAGLMDGTITNCQVAATVVGLNDVGGVVGQAYQLVTGSSFSGSVTGEERVGGIAGTADDSISNSYNTGSVEGKTTVGGIVGEGAGNFSNCHNSGSVKGVKNVVGGIAGSNSGSLVNCYNTGNVSAYYSSVGGIGGANTGSLANCFYRTGSAVYGEWGKAIISNGIGNTADAAGQTEVKTAAAFASEEIAWQLNYYSGFDQANWHHWTQNSGEASPSFLLDGSNIFEKKVTLDYEDSTPDRVFYGAEGSSLIGLPSPPVGYIYTYTVGGTTTSQAEMANYKFTAVNDVVFTVKKYQLAVNNEGVIEIDTPEELTEFAKYVNAGNTGANAILTVDIALRDTSNWSAWNAATDFGSIPAWTPIGLSYDQPYAGTFDGNKKTISGIYINAPNSNYQGLFGYCTGSAAIKNLKVAASYINGGNYTGGIAGCTEGSIINCQVEANLVGSYDVGGMAGKTSNTISDSSHTGIVIGNGRVGGITGSINATSSVRNCYSSGSVAGSNSSPDIGGIVGLLGSPGNVSNCYNTSAVTGFGANVGGIAGTVHGSISNCYNTGSMSGNSKVGGIAGDETAVGHVQSCYNTGHVEGNSGVGGIAGNASGTDPITNCFYLTGSAVYRESGASAVGIGGTTQDTPGTTDVKSSTAFASGEVTWRLQAGQPEPTLPVWNQQLTGSPADELPLLKTTDKICQVTFQAGNGMTAETKAYVNLDGNVTPPPSTAGYVWKDPKQAVFGAETAVTGDIAVKCGITNPPTATAAYGTRLGTITFSGGSVPVANWSWNEQNKDTVLAVGNTTAYPANYTPSDAAFATETFSITPVITPRSLSADGVSISQLANTSYTGAAIEPAVTVTDSGATITAGDYTVAYTSNTSPGTATVTITGQSNYQGTITRNFTIYSSGGGGYTPPSMWGITVMPGTISFDPTGQLAVDITGAPAGAVVYYSLNGSSYSTTPPAITNAGEHRVFIRITCPGYQDYRTQTTVTVAKQVAPTIPVVSLPISGGQPAGSIDLAALLPSDRGLTRYQLGPVTDPGEILDGVPTIDPNGLISYSFRSQSANSGEMATTAATNKAAAAATITVLVSMENYEDTTITLVVKGSEPELPAPSIGVRYLTHVQDFGWETEWVTDGALSGTYGQSKRLEALKVELTGELPAGATIETAVHVQNQGDLGPFAMGSAAGTTGLSLRLGNICLTLNKLPGYTLLYNVHVQDQGWLRDENDSSSWFRSGEVAGTSALSLRLEGIQIKLVKSETDGY